MNKREKKVVARKKHYAKMGVKREQFERHQIAWMLRIAGNKKKTV